MADNTNECLTLNFFKVVLISIIIYVLILYLNDEFNNSNQENFEDDRKKKETLHTTITNNCDLSYCNANNWMFPENKTTIPEGYTMTNASTTQGCCIINKDLENYIYDANGNNRKRMHKEDNGILMDKYMIINNNH